MYNVLSLPKLVAAVKQRPAHKRISYVMATVEMVQELPSPPKGEYIAVVEHHEALGSSRAEREFDSKVGEMIWPVGFKFSEDQLYSFAAALVERYPAFNEDFSGLVLELEKAVSIGDTQ